MESEIRTLMHCWWDYKVLQCFKKLAISQKLIIETLVAYVSVVIYLSGI
jgi:hypothetical protein